MGATSFIFLNHASFIVRTGNNFLLTDPWYMKPAFGSWLPVPPLFIHPVYLTSLKGLKILISHAHDDHFDDEFVSLFDKKTIFITAQYKSKSVTRRLNKLGFFNVIEVGSEGESLDGFHIKSFINPIVSHDDALYSIRTDDALLIHANDCWNPLTESTLITLQSEFLKVPKDNGILMSQSNSASGFPLTYNNFTNERKETLLVEKIRKMSEQGIKNAAEIGVNKFLGYAGYSLPFVKNHEEYISQSIFPQPSYIKSLVDSDHLGVEILNMVPGDSFSFAEGVQSFAWEFSGDIKNKSIDFYNHYKHSNHGDSYNLKDIDNTEEFKNKIKYFLLDFEEEVLSQIERKNYEPTILNKVMKLKVEDFGYSISLMFGKGIGNYKTFNKKIILKSSMMNSVLLGTSTFENLYVGYNARFERNPENVYNRDIIMHLINFSYKYQSIRKSK